MPETHCTMVTATVCVLFKTLILCDYYPDHCLALGGSEVIDMLTLSRVLLLQSPEFSVASVSVAFLFCNIGCL
eukprot:1803622-Amphidinium_carterae.1